MSSNVLLSVKELPEIFQMMIKYPESRSHMLFLGPPGSAKTTTAQSLAVALHGKDLNKFASLLFLNSSDERSLETMRQKIYPFVESRMQNLFFSEIQEEGGASKDCPKIIIFDEAETLTDQAQCALRPLLQRSTKDVIVIFICNSLSHIHNQILNKFLIIPFSPTPSNKLKDILNFQVPRFDSLYRRGDIRFFKQCPSQNRQITHFLYRMLHQRKINDIYTLAVEPGTPFRERITWFLLFQQSASVPPPQTRELSIWSALSAPETQPYVDEETFKKLLYKLWSTRMANLLTPFFPESIP